MRCPKAPISRSKLVKIPTDTGLLSKNNDEPVTIEDKFITGSRASVIRRTSLTREVGYKTKPLDPQFLQKPNEFPETSEHNGHKVRAAGIQRMDGDEKPLPTAHGIHGTAVAVDWDNCTADGVCMDVCPVFVFEWVLNPGQAGTGKDKVLEPNSEEYNLWRSDKSEPIREPDCIYCMACETSCPTQCIKITQP